MPRPPSPELEEAVLRYARSEPELGQFSVAARMQEQGIAISASGVRAIWKRHGLETVYKRLSGLADGRRGANAALTPPQEAKLVRAKRRSQLRRREPAPGGTRAAETMQHLLVVAAREFQRLGYGGATLKGIGEQAGLLPGSLFHYFRSKEDLLTKVHHAGFVQLNEALDQALEGVTDPVERLRAACRSHLRLLVSGNALASFMGTTLFVPQNRSLKTQMLRDRRHYEDRFRGLVDAVPLPTAADRRIVRLGLLGALNWTRIWYQPGKYAPEQIADGFVDAFVRGGPR